MSVCRIEAPLRTIAQAAGKPFDLFDPAVTFSRKCVIEIMPFDLSSALRRFISPSKLRRYRVLPSSVEVDVRGVP